VTAILLTALVLGAMGSVHCIGMCGPLALSLPIASDKPMGRFAGSFLYNLGRVCTYAILGAVAGVMGQSFAIFGIQQWIAVLSGTLIIIYLLWPSVFLFRRSHTQVQRLFTTIRQALSIQFQKAGYRSLFYIGILNGLFPCGLVYMALAGSINTGSVVYGSLFMAAFGLGTLPLMWALTFFGNSMPTAIRVNIKKAYPFVLGTVACLLIIRGLGLGIPYLSPKGLGGNTDKIVAVDCHPRHAVVQ
jgi:sulfite exporter TauE/SafE